MCMADKNYVNERGNGLGPMSNIKVENNMKMSTSEKPTNFNVNHSQFPFISQMSSLRPSPSAASLNLSAYGFFPPQYQQLLQQSSANIPNSSTHQLMNASANGGQIGSGLATRNLHTQRWLQSQPYNTYGSPHQSRATSVMSSVSGQSIPDDLSTLSQLTGMSMSRPDWQNLSISLNNNGNLLSNMTSPSCSENVDPNNKNLDEIMEQLSTIISDDDPDVFLECITTLRHFQNVFSKLKEPHLRMLVRGAVQLLSENQRLSNEHCERLSICLAELSKTNLFKRFLGEFAVKIVVLYCNLLARGLSKTLALLDVVQRAIFICGPSNEEVYEAVRNERFLKHILEVISLQPSFYKCMAIGVLKKLIHKRFKWKLFVICEGGIEILLDAKIHRVERIRKYAFEILDSLFAPPRKDEHELKNYQELRKAAFHKAIQAIVTFMLRKAERCSSIDSKFVKFVKEAFHTLGVISNDPIIFELNINDQLEYVINLVQLIRTSTDPVHGNEEDRNNVVKITDYLFGFLRNVLVANPFAQAYLTTSADNFKMMLRFLNEMMDFLKCERSVPVGTQSERDRIATVFSLFQSIVSAISFLNKQTNPHWVDASRMIEESKEMRDLSAYLCDFFEEYDWIARRMIPCWRRMLRCGIVPRDSKTHICLVKFIYYEILQREKGAHLNEKDKSSRAFQFAFEVLAKMVELSHNHENIINYFKGEGSIDLFKLLENTSDVSLCVAVLTMIDIMCAKDYSLRATWSQDSGAVQMIDICVNSTNEDMSELCQRIKQKLKINEDYTMCDAMSNLGAYN